VRIFSLKWVLVTTSIGLLAYHYVAIEPHSYLGFWIKNGPFFWPVLEVVTKVAFLPLAARQLSGNLLGKVFLTLSIGLLVILFLHPDVQVLVMNMAILAMFIYRREKVVLEAGALFAATAFYAAATFFLSYPDPVWVAVSGLSMVHFFIQLWLVKRQLRGGVHPPATATHTVPTVPATVKTVVGKSPKPGGVKKVIKKGKWRP